MLDSEGVGDIGCSRDGVCPTGTLCGGAGLGAPPLARPLLAGFIAACGGPLLPDGGGRSLPATGRREGLGLVEEVGTGGLVVLVLGGGGLIGPRASGLTA